MFEGWSDWSDDECFGLTRSEESLRRFLLIQFYRFSFSWCHWHVFIFNYCMIVLITVIIYDSDIMNYDELWMIMIITPQFLRGYFVILLSILILYTPPVWWQELSVANLLPPAFLGKRRLVVGNCGKNEGSRDVPMMFLFGSTRRWKSICMNVLYKC